MSVSKKIRFKVQAHTCEQVNQAVEKIVGVARAVGGDASVVAFPKKQEIFTVNRSPHVDKKSREQFQLCTHRRLLDIHTPTPEIGQRVIDELVKAELLAGLQIDVKA